MNSQEKSYKKMEEPLKYVITKYVSLNEDECKRNNVILKQILDVLIENFKKESPLFKEMYRRIFYGGSYYDGLRVGNPEEYDLDLLFSLPKLTRPQVTSGTLPGYLKIKLDTLEDLLQQRNTLDQYYIDLKSFVDGNKYVINTKIYSWMQGLTDKVFNNLPSENDTKYIEVNNIKYFIKMRKSGPAVTLLVEGGDPDKRVKIDVDLVPCFVLNHSEIPFELSDEKKELFSGNGTKGEFFVVPKPVKGKAQDAKTNLGQEWRMSFQEQERELISGKNTLKTSLRLMKKMRDNLKHTDIASYYLKTVYLLEVGKLEIEFWNNPVAYVFLQMLKKYQAYIQKGRIDYFWNDNNNLIEGIKKERLTQIKAAIDKIVNEIEQRPQDLFVIVKHICTPKELEEVKEKFKGQQSEVLSNDLLSKIVTTPVASCKKLKVQASSSNTPSRESSPPTFPNTETKLDQILDCLKNLQSSVNTLTNKVNTLQADNKDLRATINSLMKHNNHSIIPNEE